MKTSEDILMDWINAVNTGDVQRLISLYNEKAILIPTFSNRILNTPDKIRHYFEQLKSREQLYVTLHTKTLTIQKLTESINILSGIYLWQFVVDNELLSFESRFTYVLDISLTAPIIHHHSSQIPRMI